MDVSDLLQGQWLTAQEIRNSKTRIATIVDAGKLEEVTGVKGDTYKALVLKVDIDNQEKQWKLNRYAVKKLVEKFGVETQVWVGKQIALTTMLVQGGKEGVVPQ